MLEKCMPLWRDAHFQDKMEKQHMLGPLLDVQDTTATTTAATTATLQLQLQPQQQVQRQPTLQQLQLQLQLHYTSFTHHNNYTNYMTPRRTTLD